MFDQLEVLPRAVDLCVDYMLRGRSMSCTVGMILDRHGRESVSGIGLWVEELLNPLLRIM